MKMLMVSALMLLSFSSATFANTDVTGICKEHAAKALSAVTGFEAEIFSVLEVGQGSMYVDHLIIFGDKNSSGIVYKATAVADAEECNFTEISVKKIY